jgi:hypothetical protein
MLALPSYLPLHKNSNPTALILIPSSKFAALDDPTVVVQPILPSDQDYYRLGLGVDLIGSTPQPNPSNSNVFSF